MRSAKYIINSDRSCDDFLQMVRDSYYVEGKKHQTWGVKYGLSRSTGKESQNTMFWELYTHIGNWNHGGNTEAARAECKLLYGIPILRRSDPVFDEYCQKHLDPEPYENQIRCMKFFDVTSEMSRSEASEYINTIIDTYAEQGLIWPDYITHQGQKRRSNLNDR